MKLLVSACLMGRNCKYNGGNNLDPHVVALQKDHELIPVCPEVLGGLKTPRVPAEIQGGKVITKDGRDVSEAYARGAEQCLAIAKKEQIKYAILQPRSPSCGVKEHYDGTFSGRLIPGPGVSAGLLIKNGITVLEPEDLGQEGGTGALNREQECKGRERQQESKEQERQQERKGQGGHKERKN